MAEPSISDEDMASLIEELKAAVIALDRVPPAATLEQRRRCTELSRVLHQATSSESRPIAEVMRRRKSVTRLLTLLESSIETGDADLCRCSLSCVASFAFIGGVRDIQGAGGMPLLVRLMGATDETIRAYAAAAMQNATSFVDELDVAALQPSVPELQRLASHPAEMVAGPARSVLDNIEQARRYQAGELDPDIVKEELRRDEALHPGGRAAAM